MTTQYHKLRDILSKMFQLDQPDLDFGIYRIMNTKREEVQDFLDHRLLAQVKEVLHQAKSGEHERLKKEIEEKKAQIRELGYDPEENPQVQELQVQYEQKAGSPEALENEVYSHLTNFFKRYYKEGDFISQRRYKEGVYAVPYEGEEIKLHWANHDQYYIKTSEYFKNYRFELPSGKKVNFELLEASTEQNNNKAQNNLERRFKLAEENVYQEVSSDVSLSAADEGSGVSKGEGTELKIFFTYELTDKKQKQADLLDEAYEILKDKLPGGWKKELLILKPTEKNPGRTLLEKHLKDYTARNTFDYFIHKDLGGFLRRELDFYIKNEILHLDDINLDNEQDFQKQLLLIKALKGVAQKIIAFLAQLEDFQKKLWLKKKFVLQSDYCLTLDRIDESFYADIAANEAQRKEWVKLFAIDDLDNYSEPLTEDFLKNNPYLVVDTQFFDRSWKYKLLGTLDRLDEHTDGLLLNSENFQALQLLQERYQEQVKCIYIDPPYNTEKDRSEGKFIYKDGFSHSSWLALLTNRQAFSTAFLGQDGVVMESLDENEYANQKLANDFLDYVGTLVLQTATDNNPTQVNTEHEYILIFAKAKRHLDYWFGQSPSKKLLLEKYSELKELHINPEDVQKALRKWIKDNKDLLPKLSHYDNVDEKGVFHDDNVANTRFGGYKYNIIHPITGKPCKIPDKGFRYPEKTMKKLIENNDILFGKDEKTLVKPKKRLENVKDLLRSIIYEDGRSSTKRFENMFFRDAFSNPKSDTLLQRLFSFPFETEGIVLDYFAGSGTTGHAVINLNREDGGQRKYIMVEMGEYFNTVTKPRIQKVIYSEDWKNGKPVSRKGSSHCFKYLRLESYEDTLNNLQLKRTKQQGELLERKHFEEEYRLHYMLEVESRESLLNTEVFKRPFGYTLKSIEHNEVKEVEVDLVETFNYLIGLVVDSIQVIKEYVVVIGDNLEGEHIAVIWRDVEKQDNAALNSFFHKTQINPRDTEFDRIYVNGDNNLENLKTAEDQWKVVLIEEEFKKRMFEEENL